jgi:glycosyltransferase involved in cell wall biosynthesis
VFVEQRRELGCAAKITENVSGNWGQAMRIGIMLRSLDEKFGIGIYTQNILKALLKSDRSHHYFLFYRNESHLGTYGHYPNVEEVVVKASNKFLWDQIAIPLAARRTKLDLLFHTKFSVPFVTKCKTVMVLHGASWFVHPELYPNKFDLIYVKAMMPLYCRKADGIISNSNLTTTDFVNILHVPPEKIKTVYYGLNPIFKPINDRELLEAVKKKYKLPNRFILTVSRYDRRKNFDNIFKAFTRCREAGALKLVAIGKDSEKYKVECRMNESGFEDDVIFPGYVEQADLPAIYNLAELFIFPSVYEEFGIPLLEAMACGCPVVASNTGAIPEITDGAAFLADPFDPDKMARGIDQITTDRHFKQVMVEKGLQRVQSFSWEIAAKATLELIEHTWNGNLNKPDM